MLDGHLVGFFVDCYVCCCCVLVLVCGRDVLFCVWVQLVFVDDFFCVVFVVVGAKVGHCFF